MDPNIMRLQKEAEERVRQTQERNRRLIAEMSEPGVSPPVRYYGRQRPDYLSERASRQLGEQPPSRSEGFYRPGDAPFKTEGPSQHTEQDKITFRRQSANSDRADRADRDAAPAEPVRRNIPIRYGRYGRHQDRYDHHDKDDRYEADDKPARSDRSEKKPGGLGFLKGLANFEQFDQEELLILFLIFLLAQEEDSLPLIVALVYLLI